MPEPGLPAIKIPSASFDDRSMSVHLIEGVKPLAKKGTPGEFTLEKISDNKLDKQTLNQIMNFLFSTENNKKNIKYRNFF